jgi:hypothetical protein
MANLFTKPTSIKRIMANELLNLLQQQLGSDDLMKHLSQQIGGADTEKTKAAASGIIATLTGAMAKNASKPEGASALANALERDHDGSILEDAIGLLSGQKQAQNQKMMNGGGILKHLLGGKQNSAIQMISQMSGLDKGQTGNLMMQLAPLLMGALGKTKRQEGLDAAGLMSLLNGTVETTRKQQGGQTMDMIAMFLDQDGDGDVKDDLVKIGGKLLSGFFRRKR